MHLVARIKVNNIHINDMHIFSMHINDMYINNMHIKINMRTCWGYFSPFSAKNMPMSIVALF